MVECIAALESSYSKYKIKRRYEGAELQKLEREHIEVFWPGTGVLVTLE